MSDDRTTMGVPGDASAARQELAQTLRIRPDELAARYELSDETIDYILRKAISQSRTRADFVDSAHGELVQRKHEFLLRQLQAGTRERVEAASRNWHFAGGAGPSPTTAEANPVANQTEDLTTLGREVSGLDARVNILLGLAGTLLVALIAGAIALWQAIGGVETRLTRELGQVETRITQQIGDVRSEVGEIRGRLSVTGQGPASPR